MQAGSLNGYSNQGFPEQYRPTIADIQTVTWYDSYGFKQLSMIGSNYDFPPIPPGGSTSNSFVSNVKGMITGSFERVDGLPGLDLVTVNYYDNRLRLICSVSDNHLGGRNNGFFGYNFSNEITESITTHYVNGQASEQIVLITQYTYDHQGRLLEEKLKLNGNDYITLKALQYNEIGDVINSYIHSSADGQIFNQKIANTYNIRGWLRKMNDPDDIGHNLFALDLRYQDPDGPAAIQADPRYNGNITQLRWNSKYDLPRAYGFSYDPLNRLTAARYGQGNVYNSNAGHFNTTYDYDANGNITNLTRKQENTLIDALTYTYDGNRLNNVNDQGTTDGYVPYTTGNYQYYPNGNLKNDPSKKIEVSYNQLNLPRLVEFDNNDYIAYTYTATGAKLRKTVTTAKTATGGVSDYSGPFLYHDNQLSCIFTPAGRIIPISVNGNVLWKYEYNLTDHLGNVRVVFAAHSHGQPEVMQQTGYYPFGMTLQQQNFGDINANPNKLLYNSKELQDDELAGSRLDWYDYGARFYDAQLGRWHVVDPSAEKYYDISPYVYTANNPVLFVDPDGRDYGIRYNSESGTIVIYARYYVSKDDQQAIDLLSESLSQWNNQSLNLRIGGVNYSLSFDLNVETSEFPSHSAENDYAGNTFSLFDGETFEFLYKNMGGSLDPSKIGGFVPESKSSGSKKDIFLRNDMDAPVERTAHEVGHTLFLSDQDQPGSVMSTRISTNQMVGVQRSDARNVARQAKRIIKADMKGGPAPAGRAVRKENE